MKKTKRRLTGSVESRLDTLRTGVGRVLGDVARQLESATALVRDRLRPRGHLALPPRSSPEPQPAAPPSPGASSPAEPRDADTWPCPSTPEVSHRGRTAPWIRFEVHAATEWGEEIVVVGNDPSLGNWSPQAGLVLTTLNPPTWSGQCQLAAAGFVLEYKYLRKNRDGSFTWEACGENRSFRVSAQSLDRLMRDKAEWPG